MKITVVLQFENAKNSYRIWANSENQIDFNNEYEKAARCTVSYAAAELKTHLEQSLDGAEIQIDDKVNPDTFNVRLVAKDFTAHGERYALIPEKDGILVEGDGRVGVLYGVYELLKRQGWRWYSPGDVGTYVPEKRAELDLPAEKEFYYSTAPVGRGFSIDGRLNENEDLFVWMARNRLNVYFYFPNCCALMKKLGFILRDGGHIFEQVLNPDRAMPSGKTLWEEHLEWFGLPAAGERCKERALRTQFCVSQPDCLQFLAEDLLSHIMNEWHNADEINVWGFDTWGGVCTCEKCKKLGNSTDQMLYMTSKFRDFLNKARKEKRLDRDVKMVLCSYEGSATLQPPENEVPQNLIDAGDHILYAPIVRCYAHEFSDSSCSYNREYDEALRGWSRLKKNIPMSILEYYNVTKFEDLPLLFMRTMKKDFKYYSALGIQGFCYMHIPMVNWGVRALTQLLFAELSWNVNVDADKLIEEYFANRYGVYKSEMKEIYSIIDEASSQITSWRAWKIKSVLHKLMCWDGNVPTVPLDVDDHFVNPEKFEEAGEQTNELWNKALNLLNEVIKAEKKNPNNVYANIEEAVNPEQLRKMRGSAKTLKCLLEDKRGVIYGADTHALTWRLGQYYNALYNGDNARADMLWEKIEELSEKMESYYFPITFTARFKGLISKDALERTQLDETVAKCRQARIKNEKI